MIRWMGAILVLIAGLPTGAAFAAPDVNSYVDCHQRTETVKLLPAWYQDLFVHAEEFMEKTQGVIDFSREQGVQTKEAEALLERARDRLRLTGNLWHDFRLGIFRQELREIEAMVSVAHDRAVQGILKRPSGPP